MSYTGIKAGLVTRLATVPALTGKVYGYEPTSIDPPMCYILLDNYERARDGTIVTMKYHALARVCIRWQSNARRGFPQAAGIAPWSCG